MFIGILGIVYYFLFIIYEITKGSLLQRFIPFLRDEKKKEDEEMEEINEDEHISESSSSNSEEEEEPVWKGLLTLLVGGALIILFSDDFINSVVYVANEANINAVLLAFFLAPIASEMPEILEAISLSRKGKINSINVAYSNLIGGTISKTSLLIGVY